MWLLIHDRIEVKPRKYYGPLALFTKTEIATVVTTQPCLFSTVWVKSVELCNER